MIKIIDIDKLFDKYISDYVYSNIGKVKPEEIENKIPILYNQFGDEKLKELDGKTPNTYYKEYSAKQLLDCLEEHLNKGVDVSDFLCEALTGKTDQVNDIIESIKQDKSEQFITYVMNILSDMGADFPADRYLEFVLWDYPDTLGELATELLSSKADSVKEKILSEFSNIDQSKKERLVEILSNIKEKDDRVFDILISEFVKHPNKVAQYVSCIGKYGDERAIPFLMTAIEDEKINYADFEEIRFAIEMLGGKYEKERDFSTDKFYNKIKGVKHKKIIN